MPRALVFVFGPTDDRRVRAQMELLAAETDEARERDAGYVLVESMPQAAQFRELAELEAGEFGVFLLVDDGGDLLPAFSARQITAPVTLWDAIDAFDRAAEDGA
ncbi:MAG TPA: hypothetical protein VIL49_11860 [Capillimicrobium sp.]